MPDGKTALASHHDGSLSLYDMATLEPIRSLGGSGAPVLAVAVSPDARRAITASSDGSVKLLDLVSGRVLGSFANGVTVPCVAFLRGDRALVLSVDETIAILDLGSMAAERIDLASSGDVPFNGAASADGGTFVVGTSRGVLLLFALR